MGEPILAPQDAPRQESRRLQRNQFKSCVQALGLAGHDFDDKEIEFLVDRGSAPPGEVFWELAQDALGEAHAKGDHVALSVVLGTMARALHRQGQPHFTVQREAHRAFLRGLAAEGSTEVELDSRCDCPTCEPNSGQRRLVSEALEHLPLPHEGCENGFCECGWSRAASADPRTQS